MWFIVFYSATRLSDVQQPPVLLLYDPLFIRPSVGSVAGMAAGTVDGEVVSTPGASSVASSIDTKTSTSSTALASPCSDISSAGRSRAGGTGGRGGEGGAGSSTFIGLPQVIPPTTSRLDQLDLLHSFYRWCCREFSEPAPPSEPRRFPDVSVAAAAGVMNGSIVTASSFMNSSNSIHTLGVVPSVASFTSGSHTIGSANGRGVERAVYSTSGSGDCLRVNGGGSRCGTGVDVRGNGVRGLGGGGGKSKQAELPEHSHGPFEGLGSEGALDLYFKRRNLGVHGAAKVMYVKCGVVTRGACNVPHTSIVYINKRCTEKLCFFLRP